MAKEKAKPLSDSEIEKKVRELKIEMLKQVQKRKAIKKEIARLLTMESANKRTMKANKIAEKNVKPKTETKLKGGKK